MLETQTKDWQRKWREDLGELKHAHRQMDGEPRPGGTTNFARLVNHLSATPLLFPCVF
jgi:hypothetical protein